MANALMPKSKPKSDPKQAFVGVFKDEVGKLQKENARLARHNDRLKESEKAATFAYQEALDRIRKKDALIAQKEETIENFREARDRLRAKLLEAADAGELGEKLADTDLVDRILGILQALMERWPEAQANEAQAKQEPSDADILEEELNLDSEPLSRAFAEVVRELDAIDYGWKGKTKP